MAISDEPFFQRTTIFAATHSCNRSFSTSIGRWGYSVAIWQAASLAALDGTLVNNGVLRGDVSLGQNVNNYTTRSTDTLTQLGEEEVFDLAEAIEQGYAVEQNGLLGGTISVAGVFGAIDDTIRTSGITAGIALNSGSVTGGGVAAEYDEETGERFTRTTVTLNGSGYLGLGDTALAMLEDSFGDTDPGIAAAGDLSAFAGGARVLGVQSLTKAGNGMFLITGALRESERMLEPGPARSIRYAAAISSIARFAHSSGRKSRSRRSRWSNCRSAGGSGPPAANAWRK